MAISPTRFARAASTLALITALAACAAQSPQTARVAVGTPLPPASSAALASTSVAADEAVRLGIQQTLDLYARAHNEHTPTLLDQAVDATNLPFRRLVMETFNDDQASVFAGQHISLTVEQAIQRDWGFVEAHVRINGGWVADWIFRELDGRWVLSEPTKAQLGERSRIESEHFVFSTTAWAEPITARIVALMEQARATVQARLGTAPDRKDQVFIETSFGGHGIVSHAQVASYTPSRDPQQPDQIMLYAPGSFSFGFYDPATGWEPILLYTLTHEYTHLVTERSFVSTIRLQRWMSEGLAEYVAGNIRAEEITVALASGTTIPLRQASATLPKRDLEHMRDLRDNLSLAYGLAGSLVAYIDERHGGMDGFWKLARAFDKTQNLDRALDQAFGVRFEEFDRGWRTWLEQTY